MMWLLEQLRENLDVILPGLVVGYILGSSGWRHL